jgi:hypothetical protein
VNVTSEISCDQSWEVEDYRVASQDDRLIV